MSQGMTGNQAKTVVLFDGVCGVCNRSIDWMIARDVEARLRFVSIQSPAGRALVEWAGFDPERLTTMIAIRGGRVLVRSDAVLELGSRVRTPLSWLVPIARLVPRPVRNAAYRLLARSRYWIFGKRDTCRVPTPGLLTHFLDPDDVQQAQAIAGVV